jgi:hypothetical protein
MWEHFAEWVISTYPKDAAVMYLHGPRSVARFLPKSIPHWERHTREYVEEVKQGTAQRPSMLRARFPEEGFGVKAASRRGVASPSRPSRGRVQRR